MRRQAQLGELTPQHMCLISINCPCAQEGEEVTYKEQTWRCDRPCSARICVASKVGLENEVCH